MDDGGVMRVSNYTSRTVTTGYRTRLSRFYKYFVIFKLCDKIA